MGDAQTHAHQYTKWKSAIPFLYDWFTSHELTWPTLSCRWGPNIAEEKFRREQYIYVSERTDNSEPNKLMLVPVKICKPRVASAESISGYHEKSKSPFVQSPHKCILHPGEVNRIVELPSNPHIVATHSDAREVYIWHFERQKNRADKKDDWGKLSVPDLTLTGHQDIAAFALAISSAEPIVASGGNDTNILLWNLADHDGGSLVRPQGSSSGGPETLAAATKLKGHKKNIEDICFKPDSPEQLASVGDDRALLLWDGRAGTGPATSIANAHRQNDVHCVSWSQTEAHLICTGGEDGSLKIWDTRKPSAAVHTFELHTQPLTRVEWASYKPGILASAGEDGVVCVWDLHRRVPPGGDSTVEGAKARTSLPHELMFQHAGHMDGVSDFQWHPSDPFTMMSVSEDKAGGSLQLWRINDLIYRPEAEVIAELEKFKDEILPKSMAAGGAKPDSGLGDSSRGQSPNGKAAGKSLEEDAEPPRATGGSAPALTPAGAFVGVPEGVAVKRVPDEEEPMALD